MSETVPNRPRITLPQPAADASAATRTDAGLDSQRLLQGSNEVLIRHGNEIYRLRHTRNDKLILTK